MSQLIIEYFDTKSLMIYHNEFVYTNLPNISKGTKRH